MEWCPTWSHQDKLMKTSNNPTQSILGGFMVHVKPAGGTKVGKETSQSQLKVISLCPQSFYRLIPFPSLYYLLHPPPDLATPSCCRLTTISFKWDNYWERQTEEYSLFLFEEPIHMLFLLCLLGNLDPSQSRFLASPDILGPKIPLKWIQFFMEFE